MAWMPRVDGTFLRDSPAALVAQGSVASIPFVTGVSINITRIPDWSLKEAHLSIRIAMTRGPSSRSQP